jgi:predicted RNA methylase
VQRDLQRGDLSCLRDFALFRDRLPASAVVDLLCGRGFLAKKQPCAHPDDVEGLDCHPSPKYICSKKLTQPLFLKSVIASSRIAE